MAWKPTVKEVLRQFNETGSWDGFSNGLMVDGDGNGIQCWGKKGWRGMGLAYIYCITQTERQQCKVPTLEIRNV